MPKSERQQDRGVRLRTVNILTVGLVLVLSAILIYTSLSVSTAYKDMTEVTNQFLVSRQCATEMIEGSDELTESARCFVVSGNLKEMWKYFKVANVSRKRSNALRALDELSPNSPAFMALENAMYGSTELMVRELYAMRLTAEARGYELTRLPLAIQRTRIAWRDLNLTPEEMQEKASLSLFDDEYHEKKAAILENATRCVEELQKESDRQHLSASRRFERLLFIQQCAIILMALIMLCMVVVLRLLLIDPLQRGVLNIRSKMPIQGGGSREFRILASAYNSMFEETRKRAGRLTYEATHDTLTGLYNRNGYEFLCKHVEWNSSAMLLVDIDAFKEVNDTYGHPVGDAVLRSVADILRGNFRFSDLICRLGGDEFVVIMRKTGPVYRDMIVKKVDHINELLKNPEDGLPVTSVSVGAAFGVDGDSASGLFERADKALYAVKNGGKSGSAFYEEL